MEPPVNRGSVPFIFSTLCCSQLLFLVFLVEASNSKRRGGMHARANAGDFCRSGFIRELIEVCVGRCNLKILRDCRGVFGRRGGSGKPVHYLSSRSCRIFSSKELPSQNPTDLRSVRIGPTTSITCSSFAFISTPTNPRVCRPSLRATFVPILSSISNRSQ